MGGGGADQPLSGASDGSSSTRFGAGAWTCVVSSTGCCACDGARGRMGAPGTRGAVTAGALGVVPAGARGGKGAPGFGFGASGMTREGTIVGPSG